MVDCILRVCNVRLATKLLVKTLARQFIRTVFDKL